MVPNLLTVFVSKEPNETQFLSMYAAMELEKVMTYLNAELEGKQYLVSDKLTGADIMISFIPELLANSGHLAKYPNIQRYHQHFRSLPGNIKATALEAEHEKA